MLVSIIIPVHQTHNFFKSCVESALAQTYSNIEVILACNGALEIKEYQNFLDIHDARLVFIKTNQGRHNARNEALTIAKGSWIQFLDYDDYLFPNKIAMQLSEANNIHGVSICKWKKFAKSIDEHYTFPFEVLFSKNQISSVELIQKLAKSRGFLATSSWLISRDLVSGVKWIDSPNDDAVFLSEVLSKQPDIIMIPKTLSGVRIHDGNTSSIRTKVEFDKLLMGWKIIRQNLYVLNVREVNIYLYVAYLYLIGYSKEIKRHRILKVIFNCCLFGFRGNVGFVMVREIKNRLFK